MLSIIQNEVLKYNSSVGLKFSCPKYSNLSIIQAASYKEVNSSHQGGTCFDVGFTC